jgi:hypothetical protein
MTIILLFGSVSRQNVINQQQGRSGSLKVVSVSREVHISIDDLNNFQCSMLLVSELKNTSVRKGNICPYIIHFSTPLSSGLQYHTRSKNTTTPTTQGFPSLVSFAD